MARSKPPIVDLEETVESINMAIYGNPGVGKTVQAGTLPNNLFLSTDISGTVSAKRQGSKAKLWKTNTWDDLSDAYEYLRAGGTDNHEWVTIDTGTRMQDLCIQGILEKVVEGNSERSLDIPAIQDHQAWQNRFKRFVDLFVALPINTCFIFHVMTVEDEEGDEYMLPQLSGGKSWVAIARSMPARFSVVGYMHERVIAEVNDDGKKVGKKVRRINWQSNKKFMAKDRYDILGAYTDDVPLNELVDRILDEGQMPKAQANPERMTPTPPGGVARKATRTRKVAAKKAAPAAPVQMNDDEEDDD